MNAHDAEHEDEAEEGATTKGNKKAPIDSANDLVLVQL